MARRKKAKSFLGKQGPLLAVVIAILGALTILLPGLIKTVEGADPSIYQGYEIVFGKQIAGAGITGLGGGDVSITFSILGLLGYFLPVVLSVLVALIIRNRQIGGLLLVISFLFSAVLLFVLPEITNVQTTIDVIGNVKTTSQTFASLGYKLNYGSIIGGALYVIGTLLSAAYAFSK